MYASCRPLKNNQRRDVRPNRIWLIAYGIIVLNIRSSRYNPQAISPMQFFSFLLAGKTAAPNICNSGEILSWKRNVGAGGVLAHLLVVARSGDCHADSGMGDAESD